MKNNTLAYILIGLTAATVVASAKTYHDVAAQQDRFNDFAYCQAQYNDVNAAITAARAAFAAEDRRNTQDLNVAIGKIVKLGEGDVNREFAKYDRRLARTDAKRTANPVPVAPRCYDRYLRSEQDPPGAP